MSEFDGWLSGVRVLFIDVVTASHACRHRDWSMNAGASLTVARSTGAARRLIGSGGERFDVGVLAHARHGDATRALCEELAGAQPECALVIVSDEGDPGLLSSARRLGAKFVSEKASVADFMFAMKGAAELSMPDLRIVAAHACRLWRLPPQQARLLYYNLWGYSNQEIADELGLSLHTVQEYQCDLRRRSGARTKGEYLRLLQEHAGRSPHGPLELPWKGTGPTG